MNRIPQAAIATGNTFLDTLSSSTMERLRPLLEKSSMERGRLLASVGSQIDFIQFPLRSVISTLAQMADGDSVEVGLTGHEGLTSVAIVLGSQLSAHTVIAQISDGALCLPASAFRENFAADSDFRDRVLAYAGYAFFASTQFAACNRLHPVQERYARWLLMAHDRVGSDSFVLTQEFTAQMLGVRRAGVNIVAGTLSTAGIISYNRGTVTILNRDALEGVSCECYRAVNDELQKLMGYSVRRMG